MSLYSHNFQLLPRPKRIFFSLGSDATRSTLPDFDNVAQLSQFTHRILKWNVTIPGFSIQAKVGASFICLLVFVVGLIMARRIYERSLWFLRVIKRPAGSILVPNAMLVFSLVEGCFGCVFVAFLWETANFFTLSTKTPTNYMLWLLLPWCGLVFGAVWAAWGTYFATPNALQSSIDNSQKSFIHRLLLRPYLVNATGLLLPVAMSISVLVPAILSNIHWQRALHMEQAWQSSYSTQTAFTQEMVQASQAIWYETLKGTRIGCITFIIWTIHGLWVGISYFGVSWSLISTITNELRKSSTIHGDNRTMAKTTFQEGNDLEEGPELARPGGGVTANHLFTQAEMEANDPVGSFFPPVRPHHVVGRQVAAVDDSGVAKADKGAQINKGPSTVVAATDKKAPKTQRDYLKGALVHIYIQLFAITPACMAFASIALLLCLTMYGKLEQPSSDGGNQFEYYFGVAIVAVIWTTCLFGAITLVAIAHRTYEPILSSHATSSNRIKEDSEDTYSSPHKNNNKNIKKANKKRGQTTSSFFETHSRVNPLSSSTRKANRSKGLGEVDEETEMPDLSSQGTLIIKKTVETYEERKRSMMLADSASLSQADDDDYYFKGGAGHRTRSNS